MYIDYIIPFRSRNHLIGLLVNPIWNYEALAHLEAHYGREGHYEFPTSDP